MDGEAIGLLALLHEGDRLRRFAEGDRQEAGGERIERAGVTGLLGVEEALQQRDGARRGHADGFVENDPAVDFDAPGARSIHVSPFLSRLGIASCLVEVLLDEVAPDLGRPQQSIDLRRIVEGRIGLEAQVRREFEVDLVSDLGAQEFLVPLERDEDVGDVLAAERHDIDGRELEIRAHLHPRHGDDMRLDHGIVDGAARNEIGEAWRTSSATRSMRCDGWAPL